MFIHLNRIGQLSLRTRVTPNKYGQIRIHVSPKVGAIKEAHQATDIGDSVLLTLALPK